LEVVMKSKWFKGVIALAIVWFMASPAHASDDDLRLAGREVQVVNKGKANNAAGLFWFRLQVRDLCVAVGSGVGDSEPGPCSDWRFLGSKAASDPQLRLPDGMSAGAWSAVEVYAQLLLEDGAEASKLQMELVDGLWVAHLDSEQRAAVGRFPDAVLSVSEVRWGDPAVPGSGPALVVPGLDIGGARQLVLGASTVPGLVQALTEEDASAEISPSNSTPVVLELPKSYRDQFQNTRDSWESILGTVAVIGGFSLAIPNAVLFFHLSSSSSTNIFDAFGRELGMIFSGILMGGGLTFAAIGGILIAIGHAKNKIQRSRLRDHLPDLRHSLARRRQVEWGMRFAFP